MAQVDYKKLYEEQLKENEKLKKSIGCLTEINKQYVNIEKINNEEIDNLKKENEFVKTKVIGLTKKCVELQEENEKLKKSDEKMTELRNHLDLKKYNELCLFKRYLKNSREKVCFLDCEIEKLKEENETLQNIIKSLTISVIITNNEEYQDVIELQNKNSIMSVMNGVERTTYTDIIKEMNEEDWNEDGNMCKIIYDEEEATLSFEVQDENQ